MSRKPKKVTLAKFGSDGRFEIGERVVADPLEQLALAARRAQSRSAPTPSSERVSSPKEPPELDPLYRTRSVDEIAARMARSETVTPDERATALLCRRVRKAERRDGTGKLIGGTGLTTLKYQEPTISRLISAGKVGSDELRAISEIEAVYGYLCSKLILRGAMFSERLDRHHGAGMPSWFLDAYFERYKPWANDWSKRRKTHNDHTLEIVYDILFSQCTGKDIDRQKGWRNGLAMQAFLGGVRDYAAMGGWVGRAVGEQWSKMAREVFPVRRVSRVAA